VVELEQRAVGVWGAKTLITQPEMPDLQAKRNSRHPQARTVPQDVAAERAEGSGQAGPEILKELKRGDYDLIVLGTRGRGRTQEGLLGSASGYIHFHAQIPLLSVPD
jgi:nucleotide-binding universal stress UspA family protein